MPLPHSQKNYSEPKHGLLAHLYFINRMSFEKVILSDDIS